MNYSQFIKFNELLESNNIKASDLSKMNEEQLNELGLVTAGIAAVGSALGLGGIAKLFGKSILSWGVNKIYMSKLAKKAEEFKKTMIDTSNKNIKTFQTKLNQVKGKPVDDQEVLNVQTQIFKTINDTLDRMVDLKTQEIDAIIDASNTMKPSTKIALKFYWEGLSSDIKIGVISDLLVKKVITSTPLINKIKKGIEDKEKAKQSEIIKTQTKINTEKAKEQSDLQDTDVPVTQNTQPAPEAKSNVAYKYTKPDEKIYNKSTTT